MPTTGTVLTGFDPQRHGYGFANSWPVGAADAVVLRQRFAAEFDALLGDRRWVETELMGHLPAFLRPPVRALVVPFARRRFAALLRAQAPGSYGLCGGMAFAALDYWRAGVPLPAAARAAAVPDRSTPESAAVRDYVWQRLLDSLEANGRYFAAQLAALHVLPRWMQSSRLLPLWSRRAWEALREHLDRGEPWPVGLVGASRSPFDSHQLLAIGYLRRGDLVDVSVYDNNAPDRICVLTLDLAGSRFALRETTASATSSWLPLRGLICEKYAPVLPV